MDVSQLAAQLISQLNGSTVPCQIRHEDLKVLITAAKQIFRSQPMLIDLSTPVKIVGNIQGQFDDLLKIFNRCGWPPVQSYLFLGGYVNSGERQVDTIALLMAMKVLHPVKVCLLRGSPECPQSNGLYGFKAECEELGYGLDIYQMFNDAFSYMPTSALIEGRILCVHGGIPKGLESLDHLNLILRPLTIRPDTMEVDLLWGDPANVNGWQLNQTRQVGNTFGPDILQEFCQQHKLDLIVRAHQVCPNGYEFFADSKLVTLWSAPWYRGRENDAAVMNVATDMTCSFEVFRVICVDANLTVN